MDLDRLLQEFEHRPFSLGNSGIPVIWIGAPQLQPVCAALHARCQPEFDRLETILCAEVNQSLMLTYLLKNAQENQLFGVRVSVPAQDIAKEVSVISVAHLWPEAISHENDLAALFGIRFVETSSDAPRSAVQVAPLGKDFGGFPMRKQFSFSPPARASGMPGGTA